MKASALGLCAMVATTASLAHAQVCENTRPTDPEGTLGYSYGSADVAFYDSPQGLARIHYALSGPSAPPPASTMVSDVPDAIAVAGEAADAALKKYLDLDYRPPVSDGDSPCPSNGGSDAVDVYVLNMAKADGQAVFDHCKAGTPLACAGFVLVENDYRAGGYTDTAEGMRTVVPHELFHLVQNAYDSNVERWWAEGSAQWAAKQIYPELHDLERLLPEYFKAPWRPLNVPPTGVAAGFLYATAIWPVFLDEQYGTELIGQVYDQLGGGEANVLDATAAVLRSHDGELQRAFSKFAAMNAATGARAPTSGGYAHAADYPAVLITENVTVADGDSMAEILSGFGAYYYQLHSDSSLQLSLDADEARVTALLLPLVDGRADLDAAKPLPTALEGDGIVVVAGQSQARTDAPFTLHADARSAADDGKGSEAEASSCAFGRSAPHGGVAAGAGLGLVVSLLGRLRARRRRTR